MKRTVFRVRGVISALLCLIMVTSTAVTRDFAGTRDSSATREYNPYVDTSKTRIKSMDTIAQELGNELARILNGKDKAKNTDHFSYEYKTKDAKGNPITPYYEARVTIQDGKKYLPINNKEDMIAFKQLVYDYARERLSTMVEYDYLYDSAISNEQLHSFSDSATDNRVVLKYHISYRTTVAQDEEMVAAAKKLITTLKLPSMDSEYKKIKAVYDYFVENYYFCTKHYKDEEVDGKTVRTQNHLENDASCLCYTPYAVLKPKDNSDTAYPAGYAVCQGFAQALQVVLKEAGISCWYVSGALKVGNSYQGHGFNLVKIDGKYYGLDVTSDIYNSVVRDKDGKDIFVKVKDKEIPKKKDIFEYKYFLKQYDGSSVSADGRLCIFIDHYEKYLKDSEGKAPKKKAPWLRIGTNVIPKLNSTGDYVPQPTGVNVFDVSTTSAKLGWVCRNPGANEFVHIFLSKTKDDKDPKFYGGYNAAKTQNSVELKNLEKNTEYWVTLIAYRNENGRRILATPIKFSFTTGIPSVSGFMYSKTKNTIQLQWNRLSDSKLNYQIIVYSSLPDANAGRNGKELGRYEVTNIQKSLGYLQNLFKDANDNPSSATTFYFRVRAYSFDDKTNPKQTIRAYGKFSSVLTVNF